MAAPAAGDPAKKPPIETASWCYRDKEDDVHHDFAWTITNFSRKINVVPNSKFTTSSFLIKHNTYSRIESFDGITSIGENLSKTEKYKGTILIKVFI